MRDMNDERLGKRPKQGIIRTIRKKLNCDSTELSSARVKTDLTTCGPRKELMSIADAEKRSRVFQERPYPLKELN
jgi:hypothetical protein